MSAEDLRQRKIEGQHRARAEQGCDLQIALEKQQQRLAARKEQLAPSCFFEHHHRKGCAKRRRAA